MILMKKGPKDEDELLHIRVGKELKKQMEILIGLGLFNNQAEITREALRDLLRKYQKEREKYKKKDGN